MYTCELCDLSFKTEQESYEHDISEKHHKKFEENEFNYGRQPSHFCSICYCGNIQGYKCWINHTQNSRHKANLKYFYEFYGADPKTVLVQEPVQSSREPKTCQKSDLVSNGFRTHNGKRSSDTFQSSHNKCNRNISSTQLSKKSKISNCSDVHEGGMMLNILETIDKDSVNTRKQEKQTQKITTINSKGKHQSVSKRLTNESRYKVSKSTSSNRCDSKKMKYGRETYSPVYPETLECLPTSIKPITIQPPNEDTNKTGELQCMEKALIISQELQSLKIKQDELEEKLRTTETELNLVKAKRRELKQERSNLLQGLNHSDSDIESHVNTSRSEPTDIRQNVSLPIQKSHVKVVASIAPLDTPDVGTSHPTHFMPNPKAVNKQQIDIPSSLSSDVTSNQQPELNQSKSAITSSPSVPETTFNVPTTSRVPSSDASAAQQETLSVPFNPIPTSSNSNGVDLERLALIRQALQSPNSWQFTFDEVDQMLKQAAAKISAKTVDQNVGSLGHPSQTRPTSDLPLTVEDKITPPIKGEPVIYPTAKIKEQSINSNEKTRTVTFDSFKTTDPPSLPLVPSILRMSPPKQVDKSHISSSSSTSSSSDDDDDGGNDNHEKTCKDKKISFTFRAKVETDMSCPLLKSESKSSGTLPNKGNIKIGEFHAFGGCATAVIDMAINPITNVAYIGGQNGTIVECDLKTHHCISKLPPRDASITKLCLNPNGESIYVGYYDHYFGEYSLQTSLLIHKNIFSSRIAALAVAPSPEVPFIFLGLFNGDILRYNLGTHAIGFLCRHTTGCYQSDFPNDKTKTCLKQQSQTPDSNESAGITSLCLVQSGTSLLLIVAGLDRSICIRSASDGTLMCCIQSSVQKGPPQGISCLPKGSFFSSYSDRSIRIYNWKTGSSELTFHVHKISSSCVMQRYIAVGDSEGAVRVYKFQPNGLPITRPVKVYFISTRGAVTSLASVGDTLIAGSLDGSVTVIVVNEPASNYVCLYGKKYGENCGIGFMDRRDLIHHVLNEHIKFESNKTVMCGWSSGRCRVRFTETQTMKASVN
ncbi:unnamed protein product [Schistosoma rodhaini]|uniref:WD_REPEATS_REGION domain-containing protein n=1 Tax=Schistosoma rodhaini TaxID=6188 RepID=A0AA85F237_9TREM|nr:unnamed protein product [Schistosoma rodhaini]